jgi:hypothetical protein
VHFVGPVAEFDGGFAGRGSKTRGTARRGEQMREEAMLLEQPFAIAHEW